jgi:hypothetical protein
LCADENGFDPQQTYEPKRRKITPRIKGPYFILPGSGLSVARSRRSKNLYSVRRVLTAAHHQAFAAIVNEALPDHESVERKTDRRLHAAVITPARSRRIFKRHFAPEDSSLTAMLFNETVDQYVRSASRERPKLSAQLGELDIFGATKPRYEGKRFVGVRLIGQGAEDLAREHNGLMAALGSSAPGSSHIKPHFEPHISLAVTGSHEVAQELIDGLNGNNIMDALRDRLRTPDGSEHSVTFGRALLRLYPINSPEA